MKLNRRGEDELRQIAERLNAEKAKNLDVIKEEGKAYGYEMAVTMTYEELVCALHQFCKIAFDTPKVSSFYVLHHYKLGKHFEALYERAKADGDALLENVFGDETEDGKFIGEFIRGWKEGVKLFSQDVGKLM